MIDWLGKLSNKIASMKARSALVIKAMAEPRLFMEMLRLEPYLRRVLADRYWLEDALERKDEVMSFLNQQGGEKALGVFRERVRSNAELAGQNTAPSGLSGRYQSSAVGSRQRHSH